MSEYKFKGHDFTELANCWNITVKSQPMKFTSNLDDEELQEMLMRPERIDVTHMINNMKMVFTIEDEEEVLIEKIKRHIREQLMIQDNQSVRNDINKFLEVLADESEHGECGDSNYPVYRALLSIECNHTVGKWISNNLEDLWS